MVTITDKEFIQYSYGIHLKEQEKTIVTGRFNNAVIESNCRSFIEYFNLLKLDKIGEAVAKLINKIT